MFLVIRLRGWHRPEAMSWYGKRLRRKPRATPFLDVRDGEGLARCMAVYRPPGAGPRDGPAGQEYMRRGFQPAQRVAKALRVHRRLAGMAVE